MNSVSSVSFSIVKTYGENPEENGLHLVSQRQPATTSNGGSNDGSNSR
jgi:hypothetical protein